MKHFVTMTVAAAALAVLPIASTMAAPAHSGIASPTGVQQVQYREYRGGGYYGGAPADAPGARYGNGSRDNVGSIGYDRSSPYGYNRFSGQRYQECMMDEGYGRVRPCSQSGRP